MIASFRLVALAVSAALASPAFAQSSIQFEKVSNISIDELAALLPEKALYSKSNGILSVWQTDTEGRERRNGRECIAVVVARLDLLGTGPVGVRVWATPGVQPLLEVSQAVSNASPEAIVVFGNDISACPGPDRATCARRLPHLRVNGDGEVSSSNGPIGKVEF